MRPIASNHTLRFCSMVWLSATTLIRGGVSVRWSDVGCFKPKSLRQSPDGAVKVTTCQDAAYGASHASLMAHQWSFPMEFLSTS